MQPPQFDSFHKYFPDIAQRETRVICVNKQSGALSGSYGLLEMYCTDPDCDCRRVMFSVISEREKDVEAVINFGWESKEFYEKWLREKDESIIKELKGPNLNSLSHQSKYAPELLKLVSTVALCDKGYIDRLKRHYKMFKEKMREMNLNQKEMKTMQAPKNRPGRNDLCPCGSGKKYKKCCMEKDISNGT